MVNFTKYNEYFVDILGEKFMRITSQKYLMGNKISFANLGKNFEICMY